MIDVSIIIPTYNRASFLRQSITGLDALEINKIPFEIIVVDNTSTDNTKHIVKEFQEKKAYSKTKLVYIYEKQLGLHFARHTGAKASNGEILVYIDDDVICDKNFLIEILKPYKDPSVGCVGGKILPKWEIEPPEWINKFPKWYLSILDDHEGPKEVQWIYGCNFSIRKSLLFELGGFNPDSFGDKKMWWMRGDGEIGLLRKAHDAGKKVIYNPKAVVWHSIPKERLTEKYFKERAFKSGIETSFIKHHYSNSTIHPLKVLLRSCKFGICYIFHNILSLVCFDMKIKHRATSSYYIARCLYEVKLAVDNNLQKFVKKERWLE